MNLITNVSPVPVTLTFTEAVSGLLIGDLAVTGGALSNLVRHPSGSEGVKSM